jgi:hypothetical protein
MALIPCRFTAPMLASPGMPWYGLSVIGGLKFDPAFARGGDHAETIAALHHPPKSRWLAKLVWDRINGVFLITGLSLSFVTSYASQLLRLCGGSIKVAHAEIGKTRPGVFEG